MALTTPYKEQFLVADGITVTFPFDDHGDGFDAISKNYVKCEVYNADGSIIVPDFTVDLSAKTITITSLTTPDGQILNAPQNGAVVRIYRDVPEAQNTTAQALQQATAQQIVQNFDNIVAMIQELQYANEHFTLRSTLPQRDLKIDLLRDIDDQKLVYWDNEKRKLVVTNYRQDELLLPADKEDILEQANAYSDGQNSALESRINGKFTAVEAQIDANADAIQKTREDYISADSEIHQILNNHASELTTLRGNQASLGDQVSGIEEKMPGNASATNQLATKADLVNVDLDGYVKKSGDTMTGDLVLDGHGASGIGPEIKFVGLGPNPSYGQEFMTTISTFRGSGLSIKDYLNGDTRNVLNFSDGFWGYSYINDKMLNSGATLYPWKTTYTKVLNAGNKVVGDTTSEFSGDLIVPSEGGTLARMEDLIDLRADINEADSELQTQITAQAAEIATKQDQLIAGDNIVISGNTISATGAGGGVGFDMQVVDQLPATGKKGVIYLVPKDGAAPDVHDEYVWIDATQTFELIGTTQVDLTDYVKNTDYAGVGGKAGVIRPQATYGVTVSPSSGVMYSNSLTLAEYQSVSTACFMSKGTLENIKKDIVERAVSEDGAVLDGYVKNTDYATDSKAGVIKTATTNGVNTSGPFLIAQPADLEKYNKRPATSFVGKGTLENIKDDLVKRGITANTITLTDEEKASARQWQGATRVIIRKWS